VVFVILPFAAPFWSAILLPQLLLRYLVKQPPASPNMICSHFVQDVSKKYDVHLVVSRVFVCET